MDLSGDFFFFIRLIHIRDIKGIVLDYTIYIVTNENQVIVWLRALVSTKVYPLRGSSILYGFSMFFFSFRAFFSIFVLLLRLYCWDSLQLIGQSNRSQCNYYYFNLTPRSLPIISTNRRIQTHFVRIYGAYQVFSIIVIISLIIIIRHRWNYMICVPLRWFFANLQYGRAMITRELTFFCIFCLLHFTLFWFFWIEIKVLNRKWFLQFFPQESGFSVVFSFIFYLWLYYLFMESSSS